MKEISKNIQDRITLIGKPDKAKWLENYVKHEIKSKGAGIPEIREIIKDVNNDYKPTEKKISEQERACRTQTTHQKTVNQQHTKKFRN